MHGQQNRHVIWPLSVVPVAPFALNPVGFASLKAYPNLFFVPL